MPFATTNDGVRLHYTVHGDAGPAVVLIHGWSGSSEYFALNVHELSKTCRVVAYDLRFHGRSDMPTWGFHVHRLAADLHDLIGSTFLASETPALLGTSLGCAVIWSYVELYGQEKLSKLVFVDQAPSQWKMPDWHTCSKGIYDAPSLANIQRAVLDMDAFADGNAECCLTKPPPKEVMELLKRETLKCDPRQLGQLMADHAPKDWRPLLPRITRPCLNLYGTDSGCFPAAGCEAVGTLIGPHCKSVAFEGCNHCACCPDTLTRWLPRPAHCVSRTRDASPALVCRALSRGARALQRARRQLPARQVAMQVAGRARAPCRCRGGTTAQRGIGFGVAQIDTIQLYCPQRTPHIRTGNKLTSADKGSCCQPCPPDPGPSARDDGTHPKRRLVKPCRPLELTQALWKADGTLHTHNTHTSAQRHETEK